ncbi:MAG: ABC transporter permease subunit [Anaerolineales bacterium]|nr:ABC transporter permease subunit [Anaerolineales bacterium]
MTRYIIRRILWFIPVVLAITFATFALVRAIPGGPFDVSGMRAVPEYIIGNLEEIYHLDEPLWKQFVIYVWNALHLDFGPSFNYKTQTVNDLLSQGLPISFQLGMMALTLGLVIGIPAGIIAALRHNTVTDYSATLVAVLGVSIPNIVLGPLLILIFGVWLDILPVAQWGAVRPADFIVYPWIPIPTPKLIQHAILPVVTLGSGISASIARLTRASLLQVIRQDYIRTARAKGLRELIVVTVHALKNSLIPVVTLLGPLFAAVVTGTFIVEQIFAIPGMGKHFVASIGQRDYPLITGATLVYAIFLVVSNLLVDITYAWLDPRITYD